MSVAPSKNLVTSSLMKLACLSLLAGASTMWAQAPGVVVDAQQLIGTGYLNPQSIATNGLADKSAVFVADTNNNRIVAIVNAQNFFFAPTGFTLVQPQAVAVDAAGNLYIGDTPSPGVGRIIKMTADNARNLTGAAVQLAGAPLTTPLALAIDSTGTLYIGDYSFATNKGTIYSLAPGATAPTPLSIQGVAPDFFPGALLRDGANTLYFADAGGSTSLGGVYSVPTSGGTAQAVPTPGFTLNGPAGVGKSAAGDLYILTQLGQTAGGPPEVVIVPVASPTTPYLLPMTGVKNGSSLVFDFVGDLDVSDSASGTVTQLTYIAPANMGHANVGQPGAQVPFNVELNADETLRGFSVVTQGDASTELTPISGGTCTNGSHTTANGGGPITTLTPYTCAQTFQATPKDPGIRLSSILVKGPGNTILASAPVYQTAFAGEETAYPLSATTTAKGLKQPQSVAISGLDKKVYIADTEAGQVFVTNGLGGTTLTPVSTGSFVLPGPGAVALDGAGNLFIADFNIGELIEVPTATNAAPSMVIPPGGVLQHPMAMAFDNLGNLYIGDAGPDGNSASTAVPGYVVKLPVGGTPFVMNIPSVSIVFPQALTVDYYSNNLYIGDGGDTTGPGQVVGVAADDIGAGPIPIAGVTNPTGLGISPAGDLYVLDGTVNTITVHPLYTYPGATGIVDYVLPLAKNTLTAASALGVSAGGQSFVVTDIAGGVNNNLVYLNGNRSTLPFGRVASGTQSQPQTATVYNIGNLGLTLGNPYDTSTTTNNAFSILGSSTCGNNLGLLVGESCTINVEFTPKGAGQTSEQLTVNSTAFNTGTPIISLTGTGTGGAVKKPNRASANAKHD